MQCLYCSLAGTVDRAYISGHVLLLFLRISILWMSIFVTRIYGLFVISPLFSHMKRSNILYRQKTFLISNNSQNRRNSFVYDDWVETQCSTRITFVEVFWAQNNNEGFSCGTCIFYYKRYLNPWWQNISAKSIYVTATTTIKPLKILGKI